MNGNNQPNQHEVVNNHRTDRRERLLDRILKCEEVLTQKVVMELLTEYHCILQQNNMMM